jgi:hypothetical protein
MTGGAKSVLACVTGLLASALGPMTVWADLEVQIYAPARPLMVKGDWVTWRCSVNGQGDEGVTVE